MKDITAPQKIKYDIIFKASNPEHDSYYVGDDEFSSEFKFPSDLRKKLESIKDDGGAIDELFELLGEDDILIDNIEEYRGSGEESNIVPEWSRHYESESKCAQMQDGSWVGWTYWYGGGKHGNPDEIEWIDDAYYIKLVKTEYVPKRFFEKVEGE